MAKKRAAKRRKTQEPHANTTPKYNAREDARAFLPKVVQKLKEGVENADELTVAVLKAAELLVKLADVNSIPAAVDDEIEIRDAQFDDRKVVPISEAM